MTIDRIFHKPALTPSVIPALLPPRGQAGDGSMTEAAGWIAPIATILAAMMTAANLGARITGWGFIVFTIGSLGWSVVAVGSGQQNLLWTNGFLTIVNAVGIWRWLGRQAVYDDGGAAAAARSAATWVPTLFAAGSIAGTKLIGSNGETIGVVVDGMVRCQDSSLAYVVVSEGGVGGIGERLHALHPHEVAFSKDGAACDLTAGELEQRQVITRDDWPATLEPVD